MIENFSVGGIEMTVEKKHIKNMYIRVVGVAGNVRITAPVFVSEAAVREFASSRVEWIKRQRQKLASRTRQGERRYETGEPHSLWGETYRLHVDAASPCGGVQVDQDLKLLTIGGGRSREEREGVMREWYRAKLREEIPSLLERCEKVVGVRAREWRIRDMSTRWGTCNVREARIWLSLNLAKRPRACLEYVITHELAHLLERYHNKTFWAYMDRFCPDWRRAKALLDEKEAAA